MAALAAHADELESLGIRVMIEPGLGDSGQLLEMNKPSVLGKE